MSTPAPPARCSPSPWTSPASAEQAGAPVPQPRVVFFVAAAAFHLRPRGRAGAGRATGLLADVRAEAVGGIDVPALGSWALCAAALAAHLGDPASARELWALGERCSPVAMHLFDSGAEAVGGIDVPALGSWALCAAALAAHLGDPATARELWALGERCAPVAMHLFGPGADPVLDAAREPGPAARQRLAVWRMRPMTEVTDRIRELADPHLQTLRR
ncbi:hypothetical protein ACQP1P_29870 [Dactylosporangium sp. CA-052675]|uniref:hypothetical protein n=1 Tax=Dactylosporangium sp. CA-052675 TaxID=3239927 RepID=UPI003D9021B0